jgi:4-hydroxy-2-oxoheptanedioate aldolase
MSNGFLDALRASKVQMGLWLGLADAYCAEICANAGFDWLLIDGEHAPNDLRTILAQLQALAAYDVHPVVRPPVGDTVVLKQLLDIGVRNLLVPMVESASQAEQLVRAVRYPPAGVRGVGSALARASRWNGIPDYLARADQDICLLLQVESLRGLQELDAIAATDGVAGVFLGPADLSASMGLLGQPGHPQVQRAIFDAIARIRAAGKAAGILTADETMARACRKAGATFVAVGTDTVLLANATKQLRARYLDAPPQADAPDQPQIY